MRHLLELARRPLGLRRVHLDKGAGGGGRGGKGGGAREGAAARRRVSARRGCGAAPTFFPSSTFWNLLGGPSGSGASTWTREQAGVVGVGRAAARGRGRQRGGESPHGEGAGPHPPSSHLQPSGTCSAAPRAPALAALGLLRLLHRPEGSHLRQRHLRRRRCRRAPRGTLPLPRRLRIRRRARLLGGRFRRLPPPQRSFRCFRAGSRRHRYR